MCNTSFRKVGGLITDNAGYIVKEWRYDLGAHMPPPTGVLEVKLNRSMSFEFLDRGDMRIKFSHEGVSHELDASVRPRREGTYLDNRLVWEHTYVPYRVFLHGNGYLDAGAWRFCQKQDMCSMRSIHS